MRLLRPRSRLSRVVDTGVLGLARGTAAHGSDLADFVLVAIGEVGGVVFLGGHGEVWVMESLVGWFGAVIVDLDACGLMKRGGGEGGEGGFIDIPWASRPRLAPRRLHPVLSRQNWVSAISCIIGFLCPEIHGFFGITGGDKELERSKLDDAITFV